MIQKYIDLKDFKNLVGLATTQKKEAYQSYLKRSHN
jgi:hypothetical protein